MSKRHRAGTLAPRPFAETVTAVRGHLSKGETKEAVELAREAHAAQATPETRALAVEAYLARLANLKVRGLEVESRMLADSVRTRFPDAGAAIDELFGVPSLASLVRPLASSDLAPDERTRIEGVISRDVTDLAALASVDSLPADHALRRAAAALDQAFVAVTSGPVTDEALLLPEVSRRSPLAPWKALVRAIAAYHRHDDAGCEQALAAIGAGSAAARLVPELRALLAGKAGGPLGAPVSLGELRPALERLEAVLRGGRPKKILRALEPAVALVRKVAPAIEPALASAVAAQAFVAGVAEKQITAALGSPVARDSRFWHHVARELEAHGQRTAAGVSWVNVAQEAVLAGRFAERSCEAGVVYLHAATLLERRSEDDEEGIRETFPGLAQDAWFFDPGKVYERACAADPHGEAFARWLAYAKGRDEHTKEADRVATAWHAALPHESAPLLYLASSAEERGALVQALGHVAKAEQLDGLNPTVKRARFRLLVAAARRHAKQRKAHLLAKDLIELDALPEAREGIRPALVAGLRWVEAALRADLGAAEERRGAVAQAIGSDAGAAFLLDALASEARVKGPPRPAATAEVLRPLARASLAVAEAGMALPVPAGAALEKALGAPRVEVEPAELEALARAALASRRPFAYAAAGAGLRLGDPSTARFLVLRARALPDFSRARRRDACAAAAELARRQRDLDLAREAVEVARAMDRRAFADREDVREGALEQAVLEAIVEREKRELAYPKAPSVADRDLEIRDLERCSCGHHHHGSDDEDDEDDDFSPADMTFAELEAAIEAVARKAWLPRKVTISLLEGLKKHVRPDGTVLPPNEIERRDPELMEQLEAVLALGAIGKQARRGRLPW